MKISKKIITVVIVLVIASLSFTGGFYSGKNNQKNTCLASQDFVYLASKNSDTASSSDETATTTKPENVDFSLYGQVWSLLSQNFVNKDKLDAQKMFYGSLHGLVSSMDDPYTIFMDPTETKEFNSDLAGTFEGIGAEIAKTVPFELDGFLAKPFAPQAILDLVNSVLQTKAS